MTTRKPVSTRELLSEALAERNAILQKIEDAGRRPFSKATVVRLTAQLHEAELLAYAYFRALELDREFEKKKARS